MSDLFPPSTMAVLEGITSHMAAKPTNPYTLEEESLWQFITEGNEPATPEQIRIFEVLTGKKFDHNYLY